MRASLLLAAIAAFAMPAGAFQSTMTRQIPLLTDQRVKRLRRERDRQTPRWLNFEARVKNVPDSPERGFELALYYRISGDSESAAAGEKWMLNHPCEVRQTALLRAVLPDAEAPKSAGPAACPPRQVGPLASMRDGVFANLDKPDFIFDRKLFLTALKAASLNDSNEIYAAIETLLALGRTESTFIREQDVSFFNSLPVRFLLSLKPAQVDHPDWMTHVAALALVASDPNGDGAQFLQGWAIEDRQMVQEGPGMAYEFFWADPYLPGVGYQNLDPWWYDEESSRLLARSDWSTQACSISIAPDSVNSSQCPAGWQAKRMEFGRLSLVPFIEACMEIEPRPTNGSLILWKMKPYERLKMTQAGKSVPEQADRAGMWRVSSNLTGKICRSK